MKPRPRPRLLDIAAEAGVSLATASRSLAQPDIVAPETLARVRAAILRLGGARALDAPRGASGSGVAAIVPTLDNPIFSRALQAMQGVLNGAGHHLLVASSDYQPETELAVLRGLLARGVDGVILVGAQRAPEAWELLEAAEIPVVLTWCEAPGFDAVVVDNHEAGRIAAEHLIGLGHKRLGVVCGLTRHNDRQRLRLQGVRDAVAAHGLELPEWRVVEQEFSLAGGRTGCAALLSLAEPPTAVICGIDQLAVGCLVEAQSRGIAVPEQLSVVGIDNLEMAAHLSPPLTTVHVPTARIGAEAAALVLARLRRQSYPTRVELPVELVTRRSSAPPADAAG
ncbi:substrate-binding domain-containing protein [Roseococcus sp. SDR]|uniref:LacI family DNA-binding transcriptional regulator n=1 Tax=Roseococcus sp. SDR TaxID=2835532 RepID=UPI001BCBAE41|nr:substrate-binding domain-containing protein [Roseococcus sp. SDR]MBS7788617.1 substrate-binding domain-containing protein [Roseococcus sp. SDR]MBV1843931.1 substrate-binding domain-containing protein [Roseococcus sp. SDR]